MPTCTPFMKYDVPAICLSFNKLQHLYQYHHHSACYPASKYSFETNLPKLAHG